MSEISMQPMTTIRLYGQLRCFGREFKLAIRSAAEAIRALCVQIPAFEKFLSTSKERGLEFAVFRGKRNLGEAELLYQGGGDIRIAPVISGGKRAGAFQTIVGSILIAVAFVLSFTPFAPVSPFLYQVGAAMVIGGVIQMLSPQPKGLNSSAASENTPGYAFGSAKNTTASGNPVPLCVGKRRWGGAIISASIYAEDQM